MAPTNTPAPAVPGMLDRPVFREAHDRWNALKGELAEVEQQIEATNAELAEQVAMVRRPIVEEAARLIAGEDATSAEELPSDRLRRLWKRKALLTEAIEQYRVKHLIPAHNTAAVEIGEQLRPYYANLQQRIAAAAETLADLVDEDHQLQEKIREQGIPSLVKGLATAMPLNGMLLNWRASDPHSRANVVINWVRETYGTGR